MQILDYRKPINYASFFIIVYHLFLLFALPVYFYYGTVQWSTVWTTLFFLFACGLSITGGYHRLFSHRSYKTHPIVEAIILFFSASSAQGSALRWSYDHRIHHAFVDTDKDPYTIKKGFWYAHCLWLLDSPREIDPKVVPDLLANKLVMFQHRFYKTCLVASNAIICIFMGLLLKDWWGAFLIGIWVRIFFLHHFTWFINSLAHTWGDKPFCQEQTAVNNFVVSLFTFGEGYHNYHHTFANDYRNGIRWFHYDPTKWLIWILNKFGLASDLKRMEDAVIERRMVLERKNLLMNRIKEVWYVKKDELEKTVDDLSNRILTAIAEYKALQEKYMTYKDQQIKSELKNLRDRINSDWKLLKKLSISIMRLKAMPMTK